jgi:uncharacterized phage-associated protein
MHSSLLIANRLLDLAKEKGMSLTPMQVLKLVYIAHGWMLALYRRPLIDDRVEAWQYGPVIPRLYNALRKYGGGQVQHNLQVEGALDAQADSIVRQVFERYGHLSGPALSRLTHAAGTPWAETYESGSFGVRISDDLIEDHYMGLAQARVG